MISYLVNGLSALDSPTTLLLLVGGTCIGMFVGMLPGLGVVLVLSLMLPFVRNLNVVPAVAMMLATQAGSYFSASITAIVLNTPGSPESFPTTLDGFPMARRGEAGRALAISATSTLTGGLIACAALIGLLQIAGPMAALFHPPEYATIIVLALVLIAQTGVIPLSKVLLSGSIGLMLSFVGSDPVTGVERFTFGMPTLFSGIGIVPFSLGVFAVTQMVSMFGSNRAVTSVDQRALRGQFRGQVRQGIGDTFRRWYHVVRSAILAVLLGLVPGIGGFTANFISYGLGQQVSRNRKDFGSGVPEGLIAAEGSSLAKEVGSLIPAVALGLPSGLGMVIFLAALTILGLQPGPTLLHSTPSLPYTMMWVMAAAGILSCVVGLVLAPRLSRVTAIRGPLMFPFIVALAILGSYAGSATMTGVVEVVIFGVLGLVIRTLGYSVAAMAIGLVLGGTFDDNLHLTGTIYGWRFVTSSPLADVFIGITVVLVVTTILRWRRTAARRGSRGLDHPVLEPLFDATIFVVSTIYLVASLGYPTQAGMVPAVVAALAGAISLFRLVGDGRSWMLERNGGVSSAPQPPIPSTPPVPWLREDGLSEDGRSADDAAASGASSASGASGRTSVAGSAAMVSTITEAEAEVAVGAPVPEGEDRHRVHVREFAALVWTAAFAVSAYVFGFEVGIPLAAFGYCMATKTFPSLRRRAVFALATAVVTGAFAMGFVQLFHLTFTGLL